MSQLELSFDPPWLRVPCGGADSGPYREGTRPEEHLYPSRYGDCSGLTACGAVLGSLWPIHRPVGPLPLCAVCAEFQ